MNLQKNDKIVFLINDSDYIYTRDFGKIIETDSDGFTVEFDDGEVW